MSWPRWCARWFNAHRLAIGLLEKELRELHDANLSYFLLMPLQRGDAVPHFEVTAIDGSRVAYRTIWQQRNLLLVSLHTGEGKAPVRPPLVGELHASQEQLGALATAVVITDGAVEGVPSPGVVIADRWGEIYLSCGGSPAGWPDVGELLEWLSYIQRECPECEGERR